MRRGRPQALTGLSISMNGNALVGIRYVCY
jgi:hypothetical protein